MKLKPLGDRIIVKVLNAEAKTAGGILLPDSAQEKPQQAEVVAVGKGKTLESGAVQAPEVKAGDKILFGKYSGTEVSADGQDYLILRNEEILAIVG